MANYGIRRNDTRIYFHKAPAFNKNVKEIEKGTANCVYSWPHFLVFSIAVTICSPKQSDSFDRQLQRRLSPGNCQKTCRRVWNLWPELWPLTSSLPLVIFTSSSTLQVLVESCEWWIFAERDPRVVFAKPPHLFRLFLFFCTCEARTRSHQLWLQCVNTFLKTACILSFVDVSRQRLSPKLFWRHFPMKTQPSWRRICTV